MPCYDSRDTEYPRIRLAHHREVELLLEDFLLGNIDEETLETKYRRSAEIMVLQTEGKLCGTYWQERPPE